MDFEQNRIGLTVRLRSILFDWFDYRTHSKIDVRFCSITEPNRTIGARLSSIEFWFDFVRLDTPGSIQSLRPVVKPTIALKRHLFTLASRKVDPIKVTGPPHAGSLWWVFDQKALWSQKFGISYKENLKVYSAKCQPKFVKPILQLVNCACGIISLFPVQLFLQLVSVKAYEEVRRHFFKRAQNYLGAHETTFFLSTLLKTLSYGAP